MLSILKSPIRSQRRRHRGRDGGRSPDLRFEPARPLRLLLRYNWDNKLIPPARVGVDQQAAPSAPADDGSAVRRSCGRYDNHLQLNRQDAPARRVG